MNSFPIPLYLILYILFFLSLLKSSSSDGHETKQQVHVSSAKFCSSKISHQVPMKPNAPAAARKSTVVMIKIIESEAKVTANDFWRHKKLDAGAAKIFSVPSTAPASSVLRVVNRRCGHGCYCNSDRLHILTYVPCGIT
ncbi:hypothetical protein YC2023_083824 [Brassica napus]